MLRRAGLQGLAALRSYAATAEGCLAARAALLAPRCPAAARPNNNVEEGDVDSRDGSMPQLAMAQGELSLPAGNSSSSSVWEELWDGLLWAVPKKKVTSSSSSTWKRRQEVEEYAGRRGLIKDACVCVVRPRTGGSGGDWCAMTWTT